VREVGEVREGAPQARGAGGTDKSPPGERWETAESASGAREAGGTEHSNDGRVAFGRIIRARPFPDSQKIAAAPTCVHFDELSLRAPREVIRGVC
jgi:hypothetical protein